MKKHCINIKGKDFLSLKEETGMPSHTLELAIYKYQGEDTDKWPTLKDLFPIDAGRVLFQKAKKQAPVNEKLDTLVKEWLRLAGIKVEEVERIQTERGLDAAASADILNMIIKVSTGKAGLDTLTEESVHFMVELLGPKNPLVKRMMTLVEDSGTYKQVVRDYGEEYGHNKEKLKKEAVGKIITQHVVNKVLTPSEVDQSEQMSKGWWKSFLDTFKLWLNKVTGLFKDFSSELYEKQLNEAAGLLANKLVSLDVSNLDTANLSNTVFYQERKETFKGFPFTVTGLKKMNTGDKRFTVRPAFFETGEYIYSNGTYLITNVFNKKVNISEVKDPDVLKAQSIGTEDIKYQHIKDFYDGKTEMYVYQIDKISDGKPKTKKLTAVESYIKHWENTIRRLNAQRLPDTPKNRDHNRALSIKITEYEQKIADLQETKDIQLIIDSTVQELKDIQRFMKSYPNYSMDQKVKMFRLADEYLSAALRLNQFIVLQDEQDKQELDAIVGQANRLYQNLMALYADYIKQYTGGELTDEDISGIKAKTSAFESLLLDISNSKLPLMQKTYEIVSNSIYRAKDEAKALFDQIDKEVLILKEYQASKGITGVNIYDFMMEKDKEGNKTGRILDAFRPEYYQLKAEKLAEAQKSGSWKAYYTWLNNNSTKTVDEKRYEEDKAKVLESFTEEDGTVNPAFQTWVDAYNPKTGKSHNNPYVSWTPNSSWTNKAYEDLQKPENAQLKKFFDFFNDLLQDRIGVLPHSGQRLSNFLPELRDSEVSGLFKDGIQGVFKGLGEWANDVFKEPVPTDRAYGIQDIDGNPEKSVPFYMMSGSLSPEEKSYDAEAVLKAFTAMSLLYEHKKRAEGPVLVARRLLRESLEDTGLTDKDKRPITLRNSNKNTLDAFDYYIDAMLYNQRKRVEGVFTKDEQGKGITASKAADNLIVYTQLLGMGLNYFAGTTNLLFGSSANIIEAQGGQNFNMKQYQKAVSTLLGTVFGPASPNTKKIELIEEYLNLSQDHYETVEAKSRLMKWVGKIAMIFMEKTEKFNQRSITISMLLNTPLKDSSGKVIGNLWDAFEVKDGALVFNKKYGENPFDYLSPAKFNLTNRIKDVIKNTHGNYDIDSPIRAKSYAIGRLAMVFRSWMPQGIQARFGSERFNTTLGRATKGRYRSLVMPKTKDNVQLGALDGIRALIASLSHGMAYGGLQAELSDLDRANMRKNAAELVFLLSLYTLGAILSGYDVPEDDEETQALMAFWIGQSIRLEADLAFYFSPGAQANIIQNFAPPLTTLTNVWDAFWALKGIVTGEDIYKAGRLRGKSKFIHKLSKVVPGWRILEKTKSLSETDPQRMVFGR